MAMLAAAGGGYWFRSRFTPGNSSFGMAPEEARKLMRRLRAISLAMADEVGGHTTMVQTLIKQLESPVPKQGGDAATAVVAAVTRILEANRVLLKNFADAQTRLQEQTRQMESYMTMAHTDPLTHLANRRAFDHELGRRVAEWQRRKVPLSIAMLDLDRFKNLNDHHGHSIGDRILRGVAKVLSETVRGMDLVARYGGEEFAVILPGTTLNVGKVVLQRVCATVAAATFRTETADLRLTLSGGLAEAANGEETSSLVQRADSALYSSKEAGRNCMHFHDGQACRRVTLTHAAEQRVYQC